MQFDFDVPVERRGTHSAKWDAIPMRYGTPDADSLPMWVADMDFRSPPQVVEILQEHVARGVFGYFGNDRPLRESICNWMARRHDWQPEPEWIVPVTGIVNALHICVQAFCRPGDKVVLQSPVYHPFYYAIQRNGCTLVANPLKPVEGRYEMDFDALRAQIDERTRMLLLCSPHNPVGRVWSKAELETLGEICLENDMLLVSDEIHHDLVFPGQRHQVTAALSPELARRTITLTAASKTFNLAGFKVGTALISDPALRREFQAQMLRNGQHSANSLGAIATTAAYDHGDEWLDALTAYLEGNYRLMRERLDNGRRGISMTRMEGTYLGWLDFTGTNLDVEEVARRVESGANIAVNHGDIFGPDGVGHLRFNFACPRSRLETALDRLEAQFPG